MISSKAKHPNCMYKWMDWIISPEGQRPGGRVVRRGAGQREGVRRRPSDKSFCTTFHADRRRPTSTRSHYWTTPRKQCVDGRGDVVQGLRRLGPGLDRDQGLTPRTAAAHAPARSAGSRSPTSCTAIGAAARLLLPARWAGSVVAYLGLARRRCFVSAFWQLDDFSGKIVKQPTPRRTSRRCGDERRLPDDRAAARSAIAALVTVTDVAARLPDRVLHGARSPAARRAGCSSSRCCMPLWASYLVKVYAWRVILAEDGILNWALEPLGLTGPGFGIVAHAGSCSATCGCRT